MAQILMQEFLSAHLKIKAPSMLQTRRNIRVFFNVSNKTVVLLQVQVQCIKTNKQQQPSKEIDNLYQH